MRRILIILFVLAVLLGIALYFIKHSPEKVSKIADFSKSDTEEQVISPFGNKTLTEKIAQPASIFAKSPRINILLLGTDIGTERKLNGQTGFNTDVMILLSADTHTNKILLISVPRDLWINNNKINALYTVYGYETLENAFEQITGQEVKGYIIADFDAFRWVVDYFGGVPVNVQRTFTDESFPTITDSGIMAINFTQGSELMSGDRALTFARSRKGNNGEGSDLMRAKRQHLILQGMAEAITQPKSSFKPANLKEFYDIVANKMETSLTLDDVYYLWDFYKDRDKYNVESFVIDDTYIYHPGMYPASPYHAWVFVSRDEGFAQLRQDIEAKLNGTFVYPTPEVTPTPATNETLSQ